MLLLAPCTPHCDGFPQASLAVSNGSVLANSTAAWDGGALYSLWGVGLLQVDGGSRLDGNTAGDFGGAIAVHDSVGRFLVQGASSLTRNNATRQDGGAVSVTHNMTEIIIAEGSEMSSNSALVWGGAIKVGQEDANGQPVPGTGYLGSLVVASGSQLRRNHGSVTGGVMMCNGGIGSILINASYVEQNWVGRGDGSTDGDGGAFFTYGSVGEVVLDLGASLSNNTANTWGGAVFAAANVGRLVLDRSSSISYNKLTNAESYGGAIVAQSSVNPAVTSSIELLRGSRMVGNTAPYLGGAVALAGSLGRLVIDGGSVLQANAACVGGALYVVKGIERVAITNGSSVVGNTAYSTSSCPNARGGAILSEGPMGSVVISGGSNVTRNNASISGGVIHIDEGGLASFLLTGGSMSYNRAGLGGGGALMVNGSVSNFTITGGSIVEGNEAQGEGGAFVLGTARGLGVGRVEIAGSVLRRNSGSFGGVLFVRGLADQVLVRGSELSYNIAPYVQASDTSGTGGALYFNDHVRNFTADGGTRIEYNAVARWGGALWFGDGVESFTLAGNSSLSQNQAMGFVYSNGGAVEVLGDVGRLAITSGSRVFNNSAYWLGGAFYISTANGTSAIGAVLLDGEARVWSNNASSGG